MADINSTAPASGSSVQIINGGDPITRNALRYTFSAKEYAILHKYLLSRSPSALSKNAPKSELQPAGALPVDDYAASTVRVTIRAFLLSYAGLKVYDRLMARLSGRVTEATDKVKQSVYKSPNFRLSASISAILFSHRILHRFFLRLRESLKSEQAKPFRRRNPGISRALTSSIAPAVGAGLAGLLLGVSTADQTRITISIYAFAKSLEYFYNLLEEWQYLTWKPWWFGGWLLMPPAAGQLLHAFVFDRDCFPASYGAFILKRSPEYIQTRPSNYPEGLPYPSTFDIVDSLANISKLRWPVFSSPILFPNAKTLPPALAKIAPITDPAHPAIQRLSCAVLHPHDPSCLRTYLKYYFRAFPTMARFFAIVYSAFALLRYKAFLKSPGAALNGLGSRVLRTSFFLTSAIGTAWSSICLFQRFLPNHVMPTSRWFWSGALAGTWAFVEKGDFSYSARLSIDSLWKVGQKKKWWRGVKNGDVLLFTASLMLINIVHEREAKAVDSAIVRKALGLFRGEGWVDRLAVLEAKKSEKSLEGESEEIKRD